MQPARQAPAQHQQQAPQEQGRGQGQDKERESGQSQGRNRSFVMTLSAVRSQVRCLQGKRTTSRRPEKNRPRPVWKAGRVRRP
jgi:hypothetical protein